MRVGRPLVLVVVQLLLLDQRLLIVVIFQPGEESGRGARARPASRSRILLMAPSGDAGDEEVVDGVRRFGGDLFMVAGEADEVVGDLPRTLFGHAVAARRKQLVLLPDCDHQFRGERNGRIMSHAPLWAFAVEGGFPDPALGIHLYD